MRHGLIISIGLVVLLIIPVFTDNVDAGVEPSPFKSINNKLNSIDNKLAVTEKLLTRILYEPPLQINEGYLGDCFLLAAIANVVEKNANTLEDLIQDNDDGTYTVEIIEELEETTKPRLDSIKDLMNDFIRDNIIDIKLLPVEFIIPFINLFGTINEISGTVDNFIAGADPIGA